MTGRRIALATLLAGGIAPAWSAPPEGVIVIRGGRIVTVSGPVLERGSVLVAGGKIAAVGPSVDAPPGAAVVEAEGKTVYPGLIDGLTTLGLVEIQSVTGSVDTTELGDVNPHARAWVAVHPHSEQIPVARANGVTAALSAPGGRLVSGQGAVIRLAGTTPAELTVLGPAALHVVFPTGRPSPEPGRLFEEPELKTFEEWQKERKRGKERALDRLRNLLEEAKAYGAALDAARAGRIDAPRPDTSMEALFPYARGTLPVVVRADDEEDIRAAVRFAGERELRLIVAGGLEAWRCADLLAEKKVPVLLKVDRLPDRESDPYDAPFAGPARLHAAGVPFAIVSDDSDMSRNLPYEAAMARAYGLPPAEALRAITLSPAEILGVADRLGSIEVGKDAHIVVADGDILDHRTRVTHVFVDGVAQSLETRHTRLYERFKDRP